MLVLMFILFVPGLILGKPRHHHHTYKRQHVAINLDNQLNSDGTTVNELQMAKEEDDMIKSRLLPNMKDMYIQREQARLEQDSGLKYPLSSDANNNFSPVESASKKFFGDDSQNFWVGGNNNNNKREDHQDEEHKMLKQQQIHPSEDEVSKEMMENSKFMNNNDDIEENGKNQEESATFNEENRYDIKTANSKDGATAAMRRDSFHDSVDFNDGFKTDDNNNDNAVPDNELAEPKTKLPRTESYRKNQNQDKISDGFGSEIDDSSKRFTTDDSKENHVDTKTDSQISNVLKSVFGQGDLEFPIQKEQYFEK